MTERHTPPTPSNAEARLFGKLQEVENRLARQEQARLGMISWGIVQPSGEISAGTGDFTCAKVAEGTYRITWKSVRASGAYAVVTSAASNVYGTTFTITNALVELIFRTTGGVATDTVFSFIVLANN